MDKNRENRLAQEKSSYLKSAAHQPVDWHPWGEEAFGAAKKLDRPILLDVGAVWCHWCHVMDGESYEDPEVSRIINENFVAVKVDRDERPDIDARYQAAVSAITGQGGWPLTAFLTPEGKVFYGGTYFPPHDLYNRPSFRRVLLSISQTYRQERAKALDSANKISEFLENQLSRRQEGVILSEEMILTPLNAISRAFDIQFGGFGEAPKFPHPGAIDLLLWRYFNGGGEWMRTVVETTLSKMGRGGVYDQLGGGFHRYSTDERWIVPHFEKMLYDNAGLLKNYIHAYGATRDEFYKEIALSMIGYIDSLLSDSEKGGFYASQDADIGHSDDGDYFTWTLEEVGEVLTTEEVEVLSRHYHIYEGGEMHTAPDRNVLFVDQEAEAIAKLLKKPVKEIAEIIKRGKARLLEARFKRPAPFVDPIIYTGWNGMMITAYFEAYKVLGLKPCLDFALKSLDRILKEALASDYTLRHSALNESSAHLLDDQVHTAHALLGAFEVTAEERYLDLAVKVMDRTLELYWDPVDGGFNDLPLESGKLGELSRGHKPMQDSPTAGANSVAVMVLDRLSDLTEKTLYRERAEEVLRYFAPLVQGYGVHAATFFLALGQHLNPPPHVVVVGKKKDLVSQDLYGAALQTYRPGKFVSLYDPDEPGSRELPKNVRAMMASGDGLSAYVCSGFVCAPPVHDREALVALLKPKKP